MSFDLPSPPWNKHQTKAVTSDYNASNDPWNTHPNHPNPCSKPGRLWNPNSWRNSSVGAEKSIILAQNRRKFFLKKCEKFQWMKWFHHPLFPFKPKGHVLWWKILPQVLYNKMSPNKTLSSDMMPSYFSWISFGLVLLRRIMIVTVDRRNLNQVITLVYPTSYRFHTFETIIWISSISSSNPGRTHDFCSINLQI